MEDVLLYHFIETLIHISVLIMPVKYNLTLQEQFLSLIIDRLTLFRYILNAFAKLNIFW